MCALSFASCDNSSDEGEYNVKFDKDELTISTDKDSATFHANSSWLMLSEVHVIQDGKNTRVFPIYPRDSAYKANALTYTSYQIDWLTFKHGSDNRSIEVVALPNTGKTRKIHFTVQFYDKWISATLIQKGQQD